MKSFSLIIICFFSYTSTNFIAQLNNQGASSTAMAGANVNEINIWSINNNISNIAHLKETQIGISVNNRFLLADLSTGSLAFTLPLKTGVIGASYSNFGNTYYQQHNAGFGYAMKLGENFSGGMKINYDYINLGNVYGSSSVISADIGLNAKLSSELNMGIIIKNPTLASPTNKSDDQFPTLIQLGMEYTVSEQLHTVIAIEKDILYPASFKAAFVYQALDIMVFRAGIGTNPTTAAFGFGTEIKGFQFDFGTQYHQLLGFSPEFSLIYSLHK